MDKVPEAYQNSTLRTKDMDNLNANRPQSAGESKKKLRRPAAAGGTIIVSYHDDMSSKFTHSPMQKVGPGPTKYAYNDRHG